MDLPVGAEPGSWADGESKLSAPKNGLLKELFKRKPGSLRGFSARPPQCAPGELARKPRPGQRILLIGGPGQGKSTLGQFACQAHRAALLDPVLETLDSFTQAAVRGLRRSRLRPKHPLLPLRIVLPEAVAWMARSGIDRTKDLPVLLSFLAEQSRDSDGAWGVSPERLLALLTEHPCLLVLDAFDEVGAPKDRGRIVSAARDLLWALARRKARGQILATTRPQGYSGELEGLGVLLRAWYLSPLSQEDALGYAAKLLSEELAEPERRKECLDRLRAGTVEPATSRLFATPLQVTILAALARRGPLPRERWALFKKYFDVTYEREIERDTYASDPLRERRSYVERIHQRVALLLQVESEREGGAGARLSRDRLKEVAEAVLAEEEVAEEERRELVQRIVRAAEERLVFLVEPEPQQFGFEIRSLQEMMAAWALADGSEELVEQRLMVAARAPLFRNVVLFLASRFFQEASGLRDALIQRVCPALEDEGASPLARETRTGARLAYEIYEEGSARGQPKRARALMERAVGVLDLPPDTSQMLLAYVVSQDTVGTLLEAVETRLGQNPDSALGAWSCLIEAVVGGEAWAKEMGDRYLSKMREPGRLLGLGSACHDWPSWLTEKSAAAPEAFCPRELATALRGSLPSFDSHGEASWPVAILLWRFRQKE